MDLPFSKCVTACTVSVTAPNSGSEVAETALPLSTVVGISDFNGKDFEETADI